MNPLDRVVQFITDSRAAGIPDRMIFEGLQVAMVESAMQQLEAAVAEPVSGATPRAIRPRVVGFTR